MLQSTYINIYIDNWSPNATIDEPDIMIWP